MMDQQIERRKSRGGLAQSNLRLCLLRTEGSQRPSTTPFGSVKATTFKNWTPMISYRLTRLRGSWRHCDRATVSEFFFHRHGLTFITGPVAPDLFERRCGRTSRLWNGY